MRIISTVPSQTELLSYLGLDDSLVGITKFCVHPDYIFRSKTRIGGTKNLDLNLIRSLKPDLILANKEENEKDQIQELAQDFKVNVTDVKDLDSALKMIREVSAICGKSKEGNALIQLIESEFKTLVPLVEKKKVLYLIWRDPWMSVGHDTFIHDMLGRCGMVNVCADTSRYPELDLTQVEADLVLLSSEPFPFNEKHIAECQVHFPDAHIKLVDGAIFSWYGSRMKEAPRYLQGVIDAIRL